ncbi:MAG: hypothetical protein IT379_06620 [Deltaproteobacteria bacterium]|nr:hypothetical protein [Deltaproteobacteria bacterium]
MTNGSVRAVVLLLGCAAGLAGCDSDTGGRAVTLELALASAPAPGESRPGVFTTSTGWDVTLTEAFIGLGPIYAYADPGAGMASTRSRRPSPLDEVMELVVPTARAHSGFDPLSGRTVRAEYLDQVAFDALAEAPTSVGPIDGEAGHAASVTVVLDAPRGALASADGALHAHQAWVVGSASRDGTTVEFEGGLDLPDDGLVRRIDGVPLSADIDDGGRLTLAIHLLEWLDHAQLDALTERAESGRMSIDRASQVRNAWYLGARDANAFTATWTPAGGGI